MPSATPSTAPDTEELAHFREKWKQEIRGRGQEPHQPHPNSDQAQPAQCAITPSESPRPRLTSALETYALAVSREQTGNHPEATRLYRNAFRLDPNVDKAYYREELARHRQRDVLASSTLPINVEELSLTENKSLIPSQTMATETLASLLETWPQPIPFTPENEARGVPIGTLPDELIVSILSSLARNTDANSIERFAAVSRRARMLSLDSTIWRQMVELTIIPYQLADPTIPLRELAERYRSDYRRVYVEHPRLRLDGVYISICHYVRDGLGENPWVTISHLITYRRFLRFLPNGEVLSYRTNEDQDIGDVVHALQPGFHRKDLCVGNWQLMGATVVVTNLVDKTPAGRIGGDKHSFQMSLTLKSRPSLGRWNKLDFLGYESVNVETGETCPLPLRHERPYWFSKVKSYQL